MKTFKIINRKVFCLYSPTKITCRQTHLPAALLVYILVVVVAMLGEMIAEIAYFLFEFDEEILPCILHRLR